MDSSVILAIAKHETDGEACLDLLIRTRALGHLVACDVVWAETVVVFPGAKEHADAMNRLGIDYLAPGEEAAARAGEMLLAYRRAGGKRERVIGDFLIGAHALVQTDALITKDTGFFRQYFKGLKVVSP